MILNIKNNKWFYIISVVQIILAIISFIYGYYYVCDPEREQSIGIGNIMSYFQFLCLSSFALNIKILCHNFLISFVSYILNIFSFGIYGCFIMAKSAFIVGNVIKLKEFSIVIFTLLELLGIIISCVVSNYIFNTFNKDQMNIKNILIITLVTIIILLIIYSIAGFIETQCIINTLNKEV